MIRQIAKRGKSTLTFFLCICILISSCLDLSTVYAILGIHALPVVAEAGDRAERPIPLRKNSGKGKAFLYCHFVETTEFKAGTTYALLDNIYGPEDAVFMLGSGAVLGATKSENESIDYIRGKYGAGAQVKTYVNVVTKGKKFDHCKIGGLYKVPDSGVPAEYRYFCGYGGAQNCGPLYAYSYEKLPVGYESVSASLKSIDRQGSKNSEDYTVTVTYGGETFTLDSGSYEVQIADPEKDAVTIIAEDSDGNRITTNFTGPLAVHYEGNAKEATNLPAIGEAWRGTSFQISSMTPLRNGYTFQNWKEKRTGTVYEKGVQIPAASVTQVLRLQAQWRDVQAPTVSCQTVEVMAHSSDENVKSAVEKALTITDNEPVSECTVTVSGTNIANAAGNKTVSVSVRDKAGNVTTKNCTVKVLALPLELKGAKFQSSAMELSATLVEPGPNPITETGFVWGIMNNPTLSLYNGKVSTDSPVNSPNSSICVPTGSLQKGVTYYARAYAVADSITYYSDEISFGIGLPAYGTFGIKNNGDSTFTVTRTGGTEGTQTVYFRTVNGSAVGGTHFTHKADKLIFERGESSKTITIAETGANVAYNSKVATAYANSNRTYAVELYRVTGGASLGSTTEAVRTLNTGNDYKIDRNLYKTVKSKVDTPNNDRKWVADRSDCGNGDLYLINDRGKNSGRPVQDGSKTYQKNYSTNIGFSDRSLYTEKQGNYLSETAVTFLYRQRLSAHEEDDAWEHVWIGDHEPPIANRNNHAGADCTSASIPLSAMGTQFPLIPERMGIGIFSAVFEIPDGGSRTVYLPDTSSNMVHTRPDNCFTYEGNTWVKVPAEKPAWACYSATGKKQDIWYVESVENFMRPYDTREPQVLGIAPMAGGLYKTGDNYTVAVIFDEIVDKTNSGSALNSVFLDTTWGTAIYKGGADTNVLYFTGTVGSGAGNPLKVNRISGTASIKDMSELSESACSGGSGSVTVSVDTSSPNFSVATGEISNGTGTAKITVNNDKAKTSGLKYVWSDSTSMPLSGWVELTASELESAKSSGGFTLSMRKKPGSGNSNGKWYLHVLGSYSTNGATTYKQALLDFGTASSPAAGVRTPSLEVSADNTSWARERTIMIQASDGDSLKYRPTGEQTWNSLGVSTKNIKVNENRYYTFMLPAGDQTITKNVLVEKIDRVNPTARIGAPTEGSAVETTKIGVYTRLTLPVTFEDEESGVNTVQYAWTNSTQTPAAAAWQTLSKAASQVTYTATEMAETVKYLHLKVTDAVGNICTVTSLPYKMISQSTVANRAPGITLTGAPSVWTNDMPTLSWRLTDYSGKNYVVTLPDEKTKAVPSGEFLATQNGTYTVTVQDKDYGGSNTASITVNKLDFAPPSVNVSGIPSEWKNTAQTVTLNTSDSQSGIGDEYYKIVDSDSEIPDTGLTHFTGNNQSVVFNQNGTYYLYYKCYDRTGDTVTGRPANMREGFAGPVRVDMQTPSLTVSSGTNGVWEADGVTLAIRAGYGPSGGKVTTGGNTVDGLTVPDSDGREGSTAETEYKVTKKGTYIFQAESGAGKTAQKEMTIYQGTLDAQNGSTVQKQLVAANGTLTEPEPPARAGYTFTGWYTERNGGTEWKFTSDTVCSDVSLYARWTANSITITPYKDNILWTQDAPVYKLQSADSGTFITDLNVVPNGTYKIYEGEKDTGETVSVNNTSETVRLDYYTVSFHDNENLLSTQTVLSGDLAVEPSSPVKTGYAFVRWKMADGSETFDFQNEINETLHLYADWRLVDYKVVYHYEGATGGNETEYTTVNYGGTYENLPIPAKTGYTFMGWYTGERGQGSLVTNETEVTVAKDHILYACWDDNTAPDAPVLKNSVVIPDGWTSVQTGIPLVLRDGVGVTELWVKEDDTEYKRVEEFVALSTEFLYPVKEEAHTYQFIAKDAAGNVSEESEIFTVRLDVTAPEAEITLGENKWGTWLNEITFGLFYKEVQTVMINGKDKGAPVERVQYYLAEDKTEVSAITDWQDYTDALYVEQGKYVIYAKVTDRAGNSVVVNSDGLVVDVTAPAVLFDGQPIDENKVYYGEHNMTVREDWLKTAFVNGVEITDTLLSEGSCVVAPAEEPQTIEVIDKAGNKVKHTVAVLSISEQDAPQGVLGVKETYAGKKDGKIIGVTTDMEYRREGETIYRRITEEMLKENALTELLPGTYYVRYCSTESCYASLDSEILVEKGRKLKIIFIADGVTVAEKEAAYDAELTDIPSVPDKNGFTGEWRDSSGGKAVFTHITEDLTIQAVYEKKPEPAKKTGGPDKTEKPKETGRPDKTAKPKKTGRPDKTAKPKETGRPNMTAKSKETDKTDKLIKIKETEKLKESEKSKELEKSVKQQKKMKYGSGKVIVTVVCDDKEYAAGVADTTAVAEVSLTPEQKKLAENGETVEVKIRVRDIRKGVPPHDKDVIEKGIQAEQNHVPGLTLGAYVDISMAVKVGMGGWEAITSTRKPIEVVIGIPKTLQSAGRKHYVIRSHDGEYTLLEDKDNKADTITISTDMFSTYAIAYQHTEKTESRCGVCHICPTFLGVCYFIWLIAVLMLVIIVILLLYRRREKKDGVPTNEGR